jgi:hypothetical protein
MIHTMPICNGVYWEQQQGGLCRMHSINAYYGRAVLSEPTFNSQCQEFDVMYPSLQTCTRWDAVSGNQENIISYILRNTDNVGVVYFAPGYTQQKLDTLGVYKLTDMVDSSHPSIFTFNKDHVWLLKRVNNTWWKVDSIGGVTHCHPDSVQGMGYGFMVVQSINALKRTMQLLQHNIKTVLGGKGVEFDRIPTYNKVILNELKMCAGLSAFEVSMCTFFHYFTIVYPSARQCVVYNKFYNIYQRNPADYTHIMKYTPYLLHYIICIYNNSEDKKSQKY